MDDQREDFLDPKKFFKEPHLNNYGPVPYLPMMWKIQTTQIREEIY